MRIPSDVGLSFFGAFASKDHGEIMGAPATNTMMAMGLSENGMNIPQ